MPHTFWRVCLLNPVEILSESPRSLRYMRALAAMPGVSVTTIGLGPRIENSTAHLDLSDGPTGVSFVRSILRLLRLMAFAISATLRQHHLTACLHSPNRRMRSNFLSHRRIRAFLEQNRPDLVIARDIYSIPLLKGLTPPRQVWIDLPDLTVEVESLPSRYRLLLGPYFNHLTRRLGDSAETFTTVSDSLSRHFLSHFGVNTFVVRNSWPFHSSTYINRHNEVASPDAVETRSVRFVYVGAAIRRRMIENCIEAFQLLPDTYSLDLFLVPTDSSYYNDLQFLVQNDPRVRILPAVPQTSLIPTMAMYDGAIVVCPATCVNSLYGLPNKLFQGIQARLPTVTGPTHEIAALIKTHDIGEISESFSPSDIADACLRLTPSRIADIQSRMESAAQSLSEERDVLLIRQLSASILRST